MFGVFAFTAMVDFFAFNTNKLKKSYALRQIPPSRCNLLKQPSIDSKGTTTLKAQKDSKDIVKIVMWHQWFNRNFIKLWEYFLCTKETKTNMFPH